MITIMYGAWADQPKNYNSINDYLEENKDDLEHFVKEYLENRKCNKTFELNSTVKDFIGRYVENHKGDAYPRADGSFEITHFNCLCLDAIDSYFYKTMFFD